jgi:prepilin-type N-terminal cleavage/methylation domain-containing protein
MQWAQKQYGFTIVELLIVIVVIAILAAITIVGYNGIQQRTQNSQTITAVKNYQKIFLNFATENGRYPVGGTNTNFCLGSGYTDDLCWDNRTYTPKASADTEIQAYAGGIPNPSTTRVYRNGTDLYRAGILYVNNFTFRYQLQGSNTECGIPEATRSFTSGVSSGPECTLQLPDPSTL